MPVAALGLGGNLGDVAKTFAAALLRLGADARCHVIAHSSVYRTPPWGKTDQPAFLNMTALVATTCSARELLDLCLAIEKLHGRERAMRWAPRTLDIDLLTYGDQLIEEAGLIVPHARLPERGFVLVPLAEIAPDLRVGGRTIAELRAKVDAAGIAIDEEATKTLAALIHEASA